MRVTIRPVTPRTQPPLPAPAVAGRRSLLPCLAAVACCCGALADARAEATDDGDTIVVTATRQQERISELLADVSVITREQIENAGQSTLEELLARQTAIEYSSSGGPGQISGIGIRGANSNHTLLLIDGVRVGSATSGTANFSRLPLAQIERIEILRGPASALYGADAIGGAIQIFTKRGEGPASVNASTGFGSYGTSDSSIGVAGGNDVVSYSLQAGYFATRGFNALRNPGGDAYNPDRDGFSRRSVSGNLALRLSPHDEIGMNFLSSQGSSRFDSYLYPDTSTARSDWRSDQDIGNVSLYSRQRLAEQWTSTLRYGRSVDDWTDRQNGIAGDFFRTDQDQLSWQNDVRLPLGKALLAAEYLRQKVSSNTSYTLDERSIRSLLAGWSGTLGAHRLQANLRRDENSQFGGKTTGFVAWGYQLTADWRTHLSYGEAFRAPTFNELYYSGWLGSGNPALKPESARNAESGITWEHGSQRLSATYFQNRIDNLIEWSSAWPSSPNNVIKATISGVSLAYVGSAGAFTGGVSIDLQRPRDDISGKRLVHRADEQMKAHLGYTRGGLRVGGEWQLVGERYDNAANTKKLGGYGLLNVFADYRLDRAWTLFARANNLLNKNYVLSSGLNGDYATAGASLFVGIRYQQK